MARHIAPNRAGVQSVSMHSDVPHLAGNYAACVQIVSGLGVVDEIAAFPTAWNDKPKTPVRMKSVEIV